MTTGLDIPETQVTAGTAPAAETISDARMLLRFVGVVFIVSALLLFFSEYLNQRGIAGLIDWLSTRPSVAFANLGIFFGITSILVFLTNGLDKGCQLSLLLLAFPIISSLKRRVQLEPLWPQDFQLTRYVLQIAPRYVPALQAIVAGTLVIASLLGAGIVLRRLYHGKFCAAARITGGLGAAMLMLPVVVMPGRIMASAPHVSAAEPAVSAVDESYRTCGFALGFVIAAREDSGIVPVDCTPETVEAVARRYLPASDTGQHPDIIIIQSESFWDPTELPGIKFAPSPAPMYQYLRASGRAFRILSPSFGGQTANVEFELMTGLSMAFKPHGSIPYNQQLRTHPAPAIPRLFASLGYRTVAIHSHDGDVYDRRSVYPNLGFAAFHAAESFSPDDRCGDYISDAAMGRHVIEELDRSDQPLLLMGVTMENHGPYLAWRYAAPEIQVTGPLPPDELAALRTYATGIHHADAMLATLIEHLRHRARPTVLLFYGDHLNEIFPSGEILRRTGFISSENTLQDRLRLHSTNAVLWANYDLPCHIAEEAISPGLIWSELLPAMGIQHPFYTGLLNDVRTITPGLSRHVCIMHDGALTARGPFTLPVIRDFYMIADDLLSGERLLLDSPLFSQGRVP